MRFARTDDNATLRVFYHCDVRSAAFSPDGGWLVSAGQPSGGRTVLKVWNLVEGKLISEIETHLGTESRLLLSPDGKWLANACGRSCLEVWELPAGFLKISARSCHPISTIAFSGVSANVVAVCVEGDTRAYSVPDGRRKIE
jgi:WD40 repeat protein